MSVYRVGVVGVREAEGVCQSVNERPDMELVGVADLVKERADAAAKQYETKAYYDAIQLFDEGLDIAIIATTNDAHAPLSIAAMERGINVICEKPIAISVEQAEQMVKMQQAKGLVTVVPFTPSLRPVYITAKRLIDDGIIGDILSVWMVRSRGFGFFSEGHRHGAIEFPEKSGQWIVHHSVHDASWFNKLLGEPKEAFTRGASTVQGKQSVEDFFSIVTYQSGINALIADSMAPLRYYNGSISGNKGTILFGSNTLEYQNDPHDQGARPQQVEVDPLPEHWLFKDANSRFHRALNAMVDNIQAGEDKWDGLLAGYHAQRVVEAQTKSLECGNLVAVEPSAF